MDKTEDFLKRHMLAASSVDADKTLDFILSSFTILPIAAFITSGYGLRI